MNKDKKIAIIGLGYVGLPLAVEFGKYRETLGFDINSSRINDLKKNIDSTLEISSDEMIQSTNLKVTSNEDDLDDSQVFIITVPTPIDKHQKPNLSHLESATETVAKHISSGDLVILFKYQSLLSVPELDAQLLK